MPVTPIDSSDVINKTPSKKLRLEDDVLRVVKISENATIPVKGSPFSTGYDLFSASDVKIAPRGRALIPTDLKIAVPEGTYGRIAPRSGLAVKKGIQTGAGVVDADYRGPLGVVLFNHDDSEFSISKGDRIAQLICEKISYPSIQEVSDLEETQRGEGGFGSTGIA